MTAELLELEKDAQDLLFRAARTANAFTDEPVGDDVVEAIYDLVKWAPTSMNIQPLRVLLVRSPEARQRLLGHMFEGNRAKTASAPLVAVLTADRNFHDQLPKVFPHFPGARDLFTGDEAARRETARFNGALQVAYFILGVRAAGLAAGPMTGLDAAGVERKFFPAGDREVLAVVNIGRPADNAFHPRNPRLDYAEVVTAA
jgi:3-hydroxypropanoate dehydrogenase